MTGSNAVVAQAQALVAQRHKKREHGLPLWLGITIGALAVFNGLPFLAPLFMKLGWVAPAQIVYLVYSGLCHQMAQRSFFLFGPKGFQMYNIADLPIQLAGLNGSARLLALRHFIGNPQMGWKVAWSDRMVYMYVTPLLLTVAYAFVRRRRAIRPLPLWAFGLLLLPMAIDGGSHVVSDLAGVGLGFRYTNAWLAALTGGIFPRSFYVGDALGSFNSLMRLLSGVTFGLGVTWLALPNIDTITPDSAPGEEANSSLT